MKGNKSKNRILNKIKDMYSIFVILALWEIFSMAGYLNTLVIPPPSEIILTLVNLLQEGKYVFNFFISSARLFSGLFISILIGVPLGLSIGYFDKIQSFFEPLISVLYPIPKITILPILILFFGIGEIPKISLIAIGCIFPIAINSFHSVKNINQIFIDMAKCFGASQLQILRKVVLPASLPYFFAGLKLAIGTGLVLLFFAETVGTTSGLGYFVMISWSNYNIPEMYATIFLFSLFGYILFSVLDLCEKHFLKWR